MAQTKQFELIIRRATSDTSEKKSEKKIVIDNATGKAVTNPSWLFKNKYTYYIVSNSTNIRNVPFTSSVFSIIDDKYRKINLSIDCQISCQPGNEVKLVESLHQSDQYPGNKLDKFIEEWLLEVIRDDPADFIDNFFQIRESLVSHIVREAREQLGLDFQGCKCLLEHEEQLETIHLSLQEVLLRFADSVKEHSFSADITLLIDGQHKINAIARMKSKANFEELLRKQLREFFFNQVRIENIYSHHEAVENAFKLHTEKLLQNFGRRVGAFLLKVSEDSEGKPIPSLEKKIIVELEVPEYARKIEVENQLFITRVDAARYTANKPDDFEKWLVENVTSIVKQIYFGRRYHEIIEQRDDLENKVKVNLKNLFAGVGYSLDQIIIIPTFDELKILKKIVFDIDEKFITRDQQEVKLKVSVKAEGDERSKKITPYLNNIQILPREMRSLVIDEIKQYLHTIRSEDFYEKFDDDENPQGTVKGGLITLIRDKLRQVFDIQTNYLSFDIGETEIIKRMDALKKGWHEFEIEIKSVADNGINIFSASFRVQDNAWGRWNIFQTQQFSVEEIKARIIKALTARLSSLHSHELNYRDEKSRLDIEDLIRTIAHDAVEKSFGLSIIVRDVYRQAVPIGLIGKKIDEKIQNLLMDKIEMLADGDFEKAEAIDMKIKRLTESMGNSRLLPPVDEKPSSSASDDHGTSNNNGQ